MRPTTRRLAAVLAAAVVLTCLAGPATAKEGLQATLDAPIALATPAGTEIIVGVTVMVPLDDGTLRGVDGSPIQLILTGRGGSTTRAAGAADGKPGHYLMRIAIPAGGVRRAEVVMHGTTDLPLVLIKDPFSFGPITPKTAQVAPPLTPPLTPFPRATGAAAAPAAPTTPTAVEAATSPEAAPESPGAAWGAVAVIAAGAALATAVLVLGRRSPGAGRVPGAGRAPGA
jgi:hypothetical protein